MKVLRIVTAAVVLASVGLVVSARLRGSPEPFQARSMRIVSLEKLVNADGSSIIRSVNIRLVTDTGAWKLIKIDPNGRPGSAMYSDNEGVFAQSKDNTLYEVSKHADGKPHLGHPSADGFRQSKQFLREDTICNYRAFVLGDVNTEVWYATEVGTIPLKTIMRGGGGAGSDLVNEAVSVEFVPVSADEIKKPSVPTAGPLIRK
jgi:hypothetical protein